MGISLLVVSLIGCASDEEKKAEHWEKAREYIEQGELDSAIIELKNVIKIDSWDDKARYELGEIYMAKNDLPEAYRSFWGALTANSENLEARLRIGQVLLLAHKTRDAREMALEILRRSPNHMEASMLFSRVLVQEGEPEAAVEVLERAIPWHPNHVPAWLELGDLQLRLGDLEEAERAYLHAVFLDKSMEGLVVEGGPYKTAPVLARHYEASGEWARAEDMYDKMIKEYPGGGIHGVMGLAGFYARRGMYDKALGAMEQAAEEREEDLDIMVQMAKLHLDYGYLGKALSLDPDDLNTVGFLVD
ncbi:MAG: tetratricopeptide repeat protein, partial [Desulfobacteraceae bacterium]